MLKVTVRFRDKDLTLAEMRTLHQRMSEETATLAADYERDGFFLLARAMTAARSAFLHELDAAIRQGEWLEASAASGLVH